MSKPLTLLPCPFCGGTPEVTRPGSSRHSSVITCTDCACSLESNESDWNTGSTWNNRAATPSPKTNAKPAPIGGDGIIRKIRVSRSEAKTRILAKAQMPWKADPLYIVLTKEKRQSKFRIEHSGPNRAEADCVFEAP